MHAVNPLLEPCSRRQRGGARRHRAPVHWWALGRSWSLVAALSVGCSGQAPPPTQAPGSCAVELPDQEPQLASAMTWVAPESRIGLELSLDVELLKAQLERQVPRRLAHVRGQDVGAAGELSYLVERAGFNVGLAGERLRVTTQVTATAEVCKRLGPLCVTYGGCRPRLLADVSVPLVIGADYSVGESVVKVGMKRGCVVLGVDQSSHVLRAAREQQVQIKRQLDQARPDVRAAVRTGWRLLHTPVSLDGQLCLRVTPTAVAQARPQLTEVNGRASLRAALAVMGRVSVEQPCADPHHAAEPAPLPPPEVQETLPPGVALQVPLQLDWSAVQAELSRGVVGQVLSGDAGESRIVKLEVAPTTAQAAPRVALAVTLTGATCGRAWFLADFVADAEGESVVLTRLSRLGEAPPGLDSEALAQLLSPKGQVTLPLDLGAGASTLKRLVRGFTQDLPEEITVDLKLVPARVTEVVPAAQGLMIVVGMEGALGLRAE